MDGSSKKSPPDPPDPSQTRVFDVRELLDGGREIIIVHGSQRYRLRVTANDKLILTK
jgi:hemin uptake protein HemP